MTPLLQEISVSLWAVAKLGFHPGRMLVDFGGRIEEVQDEFLPQACSNTLWALAVLQVCTARSMRHWKTDPRLLCCLPE